MMLVRQRIKSLPREVWSEGDNFIQSHGIMEGQPYGEIKHLEIEGGYGLLYFPEITSPTYGQDEVIQEEVDGAVISRESGSDFIFPWAPSESMDVDYRGRLRGLRWILSFLPPNSEPMFIGVNYPASPYYSIESKHGYMSVSPSDHPDRDLTYREEYGPKTPLSEYAGKRYDWFADLEDLKGVTTMDTSKFPHSDETRLYLKKLEKKVGNYGGPFMDPRQIGNYHGRAQNTDYWIEKELTDSTNTNGHIFLFYKSIFWVAINKKLYDRRENGS